MCALLGLSGLCCGTDHMLSWPCLCLAVSTLLRQLARDSVCWTGRREHRPLPLGALADRVVVEGRSQGSLLPSQVGGVSG